MSSGRIAATLLALAAVGATGCAPFGSDGPTSTPAITLVMAPAPNSLDPGLADGSAALEAAWLAYTPLLSYQHASGVAGTQLIPGLAANLPVISDGGRTYQMTLRPGLVYSDGRPVRASDFTWTVERAIRLHRAGAVAGIASQIVGARAFAGGRASRISGITTDDATGSIAVQLITAHGWFEYVLASPSLGLVPRGTPMRPLSRNPPPGVGPYLITNVVPGRSFSLIKNPRWETTSIAGIPAGHVDVNVEFAPNPAAGARPVLHDVADVFDSSAPLSPPRLAGIGQEAPDRILSHVMNATYLVFFDVTRQPFSSLLARQAIGAALSEPTMASLDEGNILPGCSLLPPGIIGHSASVCPNGEKPQLRTGDLAAARALVTRSGTAGDSVTLLTQPAEPLPQWVAYYAALLAQIGFKPHVIPVPADRYYRALSSGPEHPQTGIGLVAPPLPSPGAFYRALVPSRDRALVPSRAAGASIADWGRVNDPYIDAQVGTLSAVPGHEVDAVGGLWQGLEEYTSDKAYAIVIGYPTVTTLVSARIDARALIFHPLVGLDWSSLRLR